MRWNGTLVTMAAAVRSGGVGSEALSCHDRPLG